MKNFYSKFRTMPLVLAAFILLASCASTTLIETEPPGAEVYLNNIHVGQTPYAMTDTKITGTCTYVMLEKEGYETLHTDICRIEEVDVSAIIGGLFVWPVFLWTMKYSPTHYYELYPLQGEDNYAPLEQDPSSKADELRELKKLLDEGIITQEEFDLEKKKILEKE